MTVLPLLLLGFFLITAYYSFRSPLWEAPEEPMHVAVVRDLAAGRIPPLASAQDRSGGEQHQPRLYYLAAAPAVGIADGTWLAGLDLPFPRGAVSAAYAGRLMSSLMGVVTIACVYLLVVTLLRDRLLAGLVAAFTALTPGFVMTSATVNNDSAVVMFSSATAFLCVRAIQHRERSMAYALLGGLAALAAAMSKLNGLFAIALFAATLPIMAIQNATLKRLRRLTFAIGMVAALLAFVWLQGSPFATDARIRGIIEGKATLSPRNWEYFRDGATPQKLISIGWDLATTYWGTAGWQTYAPLGDVIYWSTSAFLALAALGLLMLVVRPEAWRQRSSRTVASAALLTLAAGLLLTAQVIAAAGAGTIAGRAHARFIFPAIGILSLALVVGFLGLLPRRWRFGAGVSLLCGLALLHLGAIFSSSPQYGGPLSGEPAWSSYRTDKPLPVRFVSGVSLVGFATKPGLLRAGDALSVTLLWRADRNQQDDFAGFVHMVDHGGQPITKSDRVPTVYRFPPRLWRSGDVIADHRALDIPTGTPPGVYKLDFGAYMPAEKAVPPLRISEPDGKAEQTRVTIGEVVIRPDMVTIPDGARVVDAEFADSIRLAGILGGERPRADRQLALTLYWSAVARPPGDYAVSVQLLAGDGTLVAQDDGPLGETLRTSLWQPGEIVQGQHLLRIPEAVRPGTYSVEVVLYDPISGARLAITEGGKARSGDMVHIGEMLVE